MANPAQFAYRTSKSIGLVEAAPNYGPLSGFERPDGNHRCCVYSPCGRYFAWAATDKVDIVDASLGFKVNALQAANVFEIGFSPRGTYISTWERATKDENGDAVKNLKIWNVTRPSQEATNGEHPIVGCFVQKSISGWNMQYTHDEKYCARIVTNEIHFYESDRLGTVWKRLRIEGVADFACSPGSTHSVAVFAPERKGQPAAVKVYNVPNFENAISQKTFFKGDKVQLKWNNDGTALIALAQTEVDKSGKSYYGETTLYLLSADGQFDARIALDKDGPIHDVAWSPNSKEFGVVYGYMPAKTTIFNLKAIPTHTFALGPRNTISFSPNSRFVFVAGFGNLAGQMDIYDLEKDHQKLCTIQGSNAIVCDWSPDGKFILTATTSPRLRVDNGVRIWHVGGGLLYNEDFLELYHVAWRPNPEAAHSKDNPLLLIPTPHHSALEYLGTVKTPSKPAGAYRPPGARGQVTPIAFRREDEGGVAYVSAGSLSTGVSAITFGKPRKRDVPGAEIVQRRDDASQDGVTLGEGEDNVSKAAAKNKKKREAKRAKGAEAQTTSLTPQIENDTERGASSPSRSPEPQKQQGGYEHRSSHGTATEVARSRRFQSHGQPSLKTAHNSNQQPPKTPDQSADNVTNGLSRSSPDRSRAEGSVLDLALSGGGGTSQDKKIRALLKKLRAIDDLKMRRAGGEKLEGTQIKKMGTENDIRRELESLGWSE